MVLFALLGAVLGIAIGSLLGAVFLILAARLVAKERVEFGEAYVTTFIASLINYGIGFAVGLVGSDAATWVALPINFLVFSTVISKRLGFGFGTACLVCLVQMLMGFALVAIILGALLAFGVLGGGA
ncbi:MAG: hypothetical protein ACF8LK_04295 [Phycisphaerales bacterium JB041]